MARSGGFLLGIALLAIACGGAPKHPRFMDGERAERAGQFYEAALAYRDACRAQPSNNEACKRAASIAAFVVDSAMAAARTACEGSTADQAERCLNVLIPARTLAPGDPTANAMADRAGATLFTACQADRLASVPQAIAALKCAGARRALVDRPTYETQLWTAAAQGASILSASLPSLTESSHAGARWMVSGAMACLEGSVAANTTHQAARDAFFARSSIPFAFDVGLQGTADRTDVYDGRCASVASQVEGSRCEGDAALRVRFELRRGPVGHRVVEQERDLRYQAGVDVVPNPERPGAEERADLADRAYRDADDELRERDQACDRARSELSSAGNCSDCAERRHADDVCASAGRAHTVMDDRRRERDDARSRLDQTPRTIEQPRFETFRYVEAHHIWDVPWTYDVGVADRRLHKEGTLTVEDIEHVGYDPAGLVADRLEPPMLGWADVHLAKQGVEEGVDALAGELTRRAERRFAACADDREAFLPDWMQCRAESQLWGPEPLAMEPFLGTLPCRSSAGAATPGR